MTTRSRRLTEACALVVLLSAEGVLFCRNLDTRTNYDEGVYLSSLDALRHGQTLGSEVFASQPPGFYLLLRLIGLFSGNSVTGARVGFLVIALLGCAGAYALGRALAGIPGALFTSLLLAILPPFPSEATRVDADVPSMSLGLVALALAAWALRQPRTSIVLAGLAGAVLAFALSVKLLALVTLVPLVGLALARRPPRRTLAAAAGGAAAVAAAFLIAYAGVLGSLWYSVVTFHRQARVYPSPKPNDEVLRHFLEFRTPSAWLVVLGLCATLVAWRRSWPLWLWVVAAIGFLLWDKPLFDHHLVLLCAALAAAAGVALGAAVDWLPGRLSPVAVVMLLLVFAVGGGQQGHRIGLRVNAEPEAKELRWATDRLRSCADGMVASDQPIAAFRAHRRVPGQLVDTSLVRLSTPSLPPGRLLRIIDREHVVAVFAGRSFLVPAVLAGLDQRFGPPRRFGTARFYAAPGICA